MPAGCCCGKACQNVNRECCVDFQNRSQNVPRQTSTAVCDDATPQPLARPDATWGPSCLVGASGVKAVIPAERLRSEREGPLLTTNQLQRGKLGSTKCKLTSDNGKKMRAQFEPGTDCLTWCLPGWVPVFCILGEIGAPLSSNKDARVDLSASDLRVSAPITTSSSGWIDHPKSVCSCANRAPVLGVK